MQVESTQLYRVRAVAELLSVSKATVYREIAAGGLAALRFGSGKGSLRVTGEAINAYIRQATVVTAHAATSQAADDLAPHAADALGGAACR